MPKHPNQDPAVPLAQTEEMMADSGLTKLEYAMIHAPYPDAARHTPWNKKLQMEMSERRAWAEALLAEANR